MEETTEESLRDENISPTKENNELDTPKTSSEEGDDDNSVCDERACRVHFEYEDEEPITPAQLRHRRKSGKDFFNNDSTIDETINLDGHLDDDDSLQEYPPCCVWDNWTTTRIQWVVGGCLSSSAVLFVRLWLNPGPLVYVVHSIVVFLDMILIHLFTNSQWLSVGGEIVTYACALAFFLTEETIFELVETTAIAMLCSFHLIASRSKVLEHEHELEEQIEDMEHRHAFMFRKSMAAVANASMSKSGKDAIELESTLSKLMEELQQDPESCEEVLADFEEEDDDDDSNDNDDNQQNRHTATVDLESGHDGSLRISVRQSISPVRPSIRKRMASKRVRRHMQRKRLFHKHIRPAGESFFEHFLDGAAGVMYTSFLGLIISEALRYGSGDK